MINYKSPVLEEHNTPSDSRCPVLSKHCLFLGKTSDKFCVSNNGFLTAYWHSLAGLIVLSLKCQWECSWIGPTLSSGENIQNELISFVSGTIRKEEMVSLVQKARYYIMATDCTPGISHLEQLTL